MNHERVRTRWINGAVALLAWWVGAPWASAAIQWEQNEFRYKASPQDTQVVAKFPFKNAGPKRITIRHVKASCGCSTPTLDKKVYEPGESGELKVLFQFGQRNGQQIKTVQVYSDDTQHPFHELKLDVLIPEPMRVRPRQVYWRTGDRPQPKTIHVAFDSNHPAHIVEVLPSNPIIQATVKTIQEGLRYEVQLSPVDTDSPTEQQVGVRIISDLPYESHQARTVYARIMQAHRVASPLHRPDQDRPRSTLGGPRGTETVQVDPGVVWWELDQPIEPKVIRVQITGPDPYWIDRIEPSDPGFRTQLKTIEPGRVYEVVVEPKGTNEPASTAIYLKGSPEPGAKVRATDHGIVILAMVAQSPSSAPSQPNR